MLPHNKIIKTTVKKFLEPENLFQIGSSRCWLDDQGYYMILIEFVWGGRIRTVWVSRFVFVTALLISVESRVLIMIFN